MRLVATAILVLLFFAVMQIFVLPPDGFMCGDQGSKYLQTLAFAEQGPLDPGIRVRSHDIDPEGKYREPQLIESRGRLLTIFMWLLPLAGAPMLALFGMRGLYVVPALSALVVFWCAARLGRRPDDRDGAITGLLVLLVTPIVFYGLELWEHAPAAACVMIAAVLLKPDEGSEDSRTVDGRAGGLGPWRCFAAGVAVMCGFLFREEAAVALPALLLGRAMSRDRDRLRDLVQASLWCLLGVLAVFVASTPMNLMMYGTPLPTHLTEEAVKSTQTSPYLTVRRDVVSMLFMPAENRLLYAVALIAGVAASIYALARTASRAALAVVHTAVLVLLALAVGVPLWRLAHGIVQFNAYAVGSSAHTWVFVLALLYSPWLLADDQTRIARYLIVSGILTVLLTAAIVPSTGGAQWSPRYFLLATPLLAVPAVQTGRSRSARRASALFARASLAASFVMLVFGIAYLEGAKNLFAGVTHSVARLTRDGDIIITDVFWVPEVASTLAPSRRMLFSWDLGNAAQMAAPGVRAGVERFSLVTYALLTNHTAPDTLEVPGAKCLYVRGEHQLGLGVPGLVLSRYSCASP